MTISVSDLGNWPPTMGRSFGRGDILQIAASEAIVCKFQRQALRMVTFGCIFSGKTYIFTYEAKTEQIAEQLAAIMLENLGQSLSALGDLKIELADDSKAAIKALSEPHCATKTPSQAA